MRFGDVTDDPEMRLAARALERMVFDRAMNRFATFHDSKSDYAKEWQEAVQNVETILWVTPDELRDVTNEVLAVFSRFYDRLADPTARSEGSLPVEVVMLSYPVRMAKGDA
jgi:hypothetical protein